MNKFKIIVSPSKKFNLDDDTTEGVRPKHLMVAKSIFAEIRAFTEQETIDKYNISDKLGNEVYKMHQEHGQKLYRAIDMYDGLVFKQLDKDELDMEWVNEHLIIVDALYGLIKPLDLIAPYRLDFNNNVVSMDLRETWKDIINKELKGYTIYNLASSEFSSLIEHDLIELNLDENLRQIKQARGQKLNEMLKSKEV